MVNSTVYLPDGQHFTVVPVFAGLLFKSNELNPHHSPYPVGWSVVLHTSDSEDAGSSSESSRSASPRGEGGGGTPVSGSVHAFRRPTLQGDSLFISSVNNPSSAEFKPAASPTRQTAMMLWVSLYWYFQQPPPDVLLPPTSHSSSTPQAGRPRGEWRIRIKRDGLLRVRNLIPKLERMGLIATLESSVIAHADGVGETDDDGWDHMYVSRSMFWQIPPALFLFSLQPVGRSSGNSNNHHGSHGGSSGGSSIGLWGGFNGGGGGNGTSSFPGSPTASRPGSPGLLDSDTSSVTSAADVLSLTATAAAHPPTLASVQSFPIGPYFSTSHLPTYYPPSPLRYTMTGNVRHPVRPRPPRMGETFYTRYVPSVKQYLSLRVASLSSKPVPYFGPRAAPPPPHSFPSFSSFARPSPYPSPYPSPEAAARLATLSDTALMQMWMAIPRVHKFWGDYSPGFLRTALASRHSFPVIGMWDGVPFGYFEIYWVKEDTLGLQIGGTQADDFDRGLHVFIGEEWARGRVPLWLTSIVQWILCSDYRTMSVCIEPRVDNERFIAHLQDAGFNKQREITFQHKQSWFGRLHRDGWQGPAL
ncbi:hypothetical protein SCUCBS95973_002246 [Sporothrix curviconia]|uniref:Acyltransferase MbtK/IucB-like conserved domain-containing protein n=1 Tax=Sporothrix curviconia TaxID=1260050 RepID=A0ABP0B5A8_9PEZI